MSRLVLQFLEGKVASAPVETQVQWAELERLYSRRLWHQLTLTLEEFVRHPCFSHGQGLVELYDNLLKDIEDRINPLSLVIILTAVTKQLPDPQAAIDFLAPLNAKVKHDRAATICIKTALADFRIAKGDLDCAESLLDECHKELDSLDGVTPVHANYYRVAAVLHKLKALYTPFYTSALQYLGCVDAATLSAADRVVMAFDLSLAALLGPGIYNMGELLAHPVLQALVGTSQAWLVDVLHAFNSGDIAKFESLSLFWQGQEDLAASAVALREKITLLALMEAVFRRPAKERVLSFADISHETTVALDHVEIVLMKALSLGLVKGSIDQVGQVATLPWVQPRVLSTAQLAGMRVRLQAWATTAQTTAHTLAAAAPELFLGAHD